MEPNPAAPARQRSPWVYFLLGCLALALASCLAVAICTGVVGKQFANIAEGVTDPKAKEANARKILGGVPEGYFVAISFSMLGIMETAILTDAAQPADGGFASGEHVFVFVHVMGTDQNKKTKLFFTQDGEDTAALRQSGINLRMTEIVKRSQLTVNGRKVYTVAGRGGIDTGSGAGGEDGLVNAMLFDCAGDALNVGVWTERDPDPTKKASELDLAGTVADDAAVTKFLAPVNPCGK